MASVVELPATGSNANVLAAAIVIGLSALAIGVSVFAVVAGVRATRRRRARGDR